MSIHSIKPTLRSPANQHGEHAIQIQAYIEGKRVKFPTGERTKKMYWLGINRVSRRHPAATRTNDRIEEVLQRVQDAYVRARSAEDVTAQRVKDEYNGKYTKKALPFFEVFDLYLNHIQQTKAHGTYKNQTYTKKHLQEFEEYAKYPLRFETINVTFLNLFLDYLVTVKGQQRATPGKYIQNVKWFMRWATKYEHNTNLAFENFDVKLRYGRKDVLSEEEVRLIETAILKPTLNKYRDMFLFMLYTGMRYSDMKAFSRNNIKEQNGEIYMDYVQKKTKGEIIGAVMPPKALRILEKYHYQAKPIHAPILEAPTIVSMGNNLQVIARELGIAKKITSHVARHTFVTLSLQRGESISWIRQYTGMTLENIKIYEHRSVSHGLRITSKS